MLTIPARGKQARPSFSLIRQSSSHVRLLQSIQVIADQFVDGITVRSGSAGYMLSKLSRLRPVHLSPAERAFLHSFDIVREH